MLCYFDSGTRREFVFICIHVGSGSNCVYFCFEYFYFVPKCLYIVMTIVSYESEGRIS